MAHPPPRGAAAAIWPPQTPERAAQAALLDVDGIPGWYNATDLAELIRLSRIASDATGVAVEFGSYQGRSSVVISKTIRRELVCVDPWLDVPGAATGEATYQAFQQNTAGRRIKSYRGGWRDWLEATAPYGFQIAICHVDADHSYQEVYDTIVAVRPLLAPGGVLCGHDYGWPSGDHAGVAQAVDELIPDRHVRGSVWSAP